MILMGASIFGYFFTLSHVTQDLVAWVGGLHVSRWLVIVLILWCPGGIIQAFGAARSWLRSWWRPRTGEAAP